MQSMQQEVVAGWHQKCGGWIRRIVLRVVTMLLAQCLLDLWSEYSPGVIILCVVLIGLIGIGLPILVLPGFLVAFTPMVIRIWVMSSAWAI